MVRNLRTAIPGQGFGEFIGQFVGLFYQCGSLKVEIKAFISVDRAACAAL